MVVHVALKYDGNSSFEAVITEDIVLIQKAMLPSHFYISNGLVNILDPQGTNLYPYSLPTVTTCKHLTTTVSLLSHFIGYFKSKPL